MPLSHRSNSSVKKDKDDVGGELDEFAIVGASRNEPDPEGLLGVVSSLGYSPAQALADLVDNAIDAEANNVAICIKGAPTEDGLNPVEVVIADDGCGMSVSELDHAMAFGAHRAEDSPSLGKFGLGLKSASFSQAKTLTVLSRSRGSAKAHGRQWTAEGIKDAWLTGHIDPAQAEQYLEDSWFGDAPKAQTLVIWRGISALNVAPDRYDAVTEEIIADISLHLGLVLHRFLEDNLNLSVYRMDNQGNKGTVYHLEPLDPFGYLSPNHAGYPAGYPKQIRVSLAEQQEMTLEAHIWPKNQKPRQLLLGRGNFASRQGFYFYRNNRLIQYGGWNGVRADAEPHLSLARVKIDLPAELESEFGLTVTKARITVPPIFPSAVLRSKAVDGTDWPSYMQAARNVYDLKSSKRPKPGLLLPGKGFPEAFQKALKEPCSKSELRGAELVECALTSEEDADIISVDHEPPKITIDSRFADTDSITQGIDWLKVMLFFQLRHVLQAERVSPRMKQDIERISEIVQRVGAANAVGADE